MTEMSYDDVMRIAKEVRDMCRHAVVVAPLHSIEPDRAVERVDLPKLLARLGLRPPVKLTARQKAANARDLPKLLAQLGLRPPVKLTARQKAANARKHAAMVARVKRENKRDLAASATHTQLDDEDG